MKYVKEEYEDPDRFEKVFSHDWSDDSHEAIREESLPDLVDVVGETEHDRIAAQLSNLPAVMRSNPEPKVAKFTAIIEQECPRTAPVSEQTDDIQPKSKRPVGRPRSDKPMSSYERKKKWLENPKNRQKHYAYQADYRKRRKATKHYHLKGDV